ncbi:type 1 glutamine amidotransferase [Psychrobacter aestuarii]|uniref:Type 1 glutamine amidotransferase n=1 Tax=Psychrobacter aestuarii TaxID=556327 RepID=A0ABN0VRB2_9GAMM|nr:type 1 glutamine amidotransferase [Psychrobacter aestuarii]
MTLRIHALLHVDFEDLGIIADWADTQGHTVSYTRFYQGDSLPEQADFDWLIVMGGPMSIHDESEYPWLVQEKPFIQQSIDAGKTVLGICLGSQLIAHVLGGQVAPSGVKEIGWLPITLTPAAAVHPLLNGLPSEPFTVFHWHGDGFSVPKGAIAIAESDAWMNQGFIYQSSAQQDAGAYTLAWQCHFEVTTDSMNNMLAHGAAEIQSEHDNYPDSVQSVDVIKTAAPAHINDNNAWLMTILNRLAGKWGV